MPKPSTLPEWGTAQSNETEPDAGHKADGWANSEVGRSDYENFEKRVTFDWFTWLDGLFDASDNLTVASVSASDFVETTEADIRHGSRTALIAAAAGVAHPVSATSWQLVGYWLVPTAANEYVEFPLPLAIGDRLASVNVRVRDTSGGHTLSMDVKKVDNTGTFTALGSTQTSAGDGTNQTLSVSGLTETAATNSYYLVQIVTDDATCTTHRVYGVQMTFDRVA
jgi:hypothetical protein